jgi:hypothetical protein
MKSSSMASTARASVAEPRREFLFFVARDSQLRGFPPKTLFGPNPYKRRTNS